MINKILKKEDGLYTIYAENEDPKDIRIYGVIKGFGGNMILIEGYDWDYILDYKSGEETFLESKVQKLELETRLKSGRLWYSADNELDYNEAKKCFEFLQSCPEIERYDSLVSYLLKEAIKVSDLDEICEMWGDFVNLYNNEDEDVPYGCCPANLVIELSKVILSAKETNGQE